MTRQALFVNEAIRDEKGNLIPCFAVEGEQGYYKTDWRWGKQIELAEPLVEQYNRELGLTEDDVTKIILSTMKEI